MHDGSRPYPLAKVFAEPDEPEAFAQMLYSAFGGFVDWEMLPPDMPEQGGVSLSRVPTTFKSEPETRFQLGCKLLWGCVAQEQAAPGGAKRG